MGSNLMFKAKRRIWNLYFKHLQRLFIRVLLDFIDPCWTFIGQSESSAFIDLFWSSPHTPVDLPRPVQN